jgi:hypothetical protein
MIITLARQRKLLLLAIAIALSVVLWPAGVSAGGTVDICGPNASECNEFVETYINPAILVLSALVGVAAVISIIIAGIQYSGSADDPGVVSKAKQRIFNTILGIVAYIFFFAFINYLVPGGIL